MNTPIANTAPVSICTTTRIRVRVVVTLLLIVACSACNGGLRPTLVQDAAATPEPPLVLDLPPAPQGTSPLSPASLDFPLESSVDDALLAWAADRSVPYVDACTLVTPAPGQFCDVFTEGDTVRLLGPSQDEIWYVVTVLRAESFDFGIGYRVADVTIAGE